MIANNDEARTLGSELSGFSKRVKETLYEDIYDTSMGVGSTALTTTYAMRTMDDMKKVFAETAAFENGKDPRSITFMGDMRHSDNKIIQMTNR